MKIESRRPENRFKGKSGSGAEVRRLEALQAQDLPQENGLSYDRPCRGAEFLQTDPVGYGDNLDLYAYVGNDPVNGVDPTGTQTTAPEQPPVDPAAQEAKQEEENDQAAALERMKEKQLRGTLTQEAANDKGGPKDSHFIMPADENRAVYEVLCGGSAVCPINITRATLQHSMDIHGKGERSDGRSFFSPRFANPDALTRLAYDVIRNGQVTRGLLPLEYNITARFPYAVGEVKNFFTGQYEPTNTVTLKVWGEPTPGTQVPYYSSSMYPSR